MANILPFPLKKRDENLEKFIDSFVEKHSDSDEVKLIDGLMIVWKKMGRDTNQEYIVIGKAIDTLLNIYGLGFNNWRTCI